MREIITKSLSRRDAALLIQFESSCVRIDDDLYACDTLIHDAGEIQAVDIANHVTQSENRICYARLPEDSRRGTGRPPPATPRHPPFLQDCSGKTGSRARNPLGARGNRELVPMYYR